MTTLTDKILFRTEFLIKVRTFFAQKNFIEVDTPSLVYSPGIETHLAALKIDEQIDSVEKYKGIKKYLHTSPEYELKKIIAQTRLDRVFQIERVYRNDPKTDYHNVEFTLLEWYQNGETLEELISFCEELVMFLVPLFESPFQRFSVDQAFQKFAGFSFHPQYLKEDLIETLYSKNIVPQSLSLEQIKKYAWDDLFFMLFLSLVEEPLKKEPPTFITHFPSQLASLSKCDPKNLYNSLRTELYIHGLEISNGFVELSDPVEQEQRFHDDIQKRKLLHKPVYPIDYDFLRLLPDIGSMVGMALGIERLMMILYQKKNISEIMYW